MSDFEHQLRRVLDQPVSVPDVDDFLEGVHRGARQRRRRRITAVGAACAALVLAAGLMLRFVGGVPEPMPTNEKVVHIGVGNGPCCVATVGGSVWVLNSRDKMLQRIDPDTNRTSEPIEVNATGMAPVGNRLLLSYSNLGNLSLFDPASGRIELIEGFSSRGSQVFDGQTLWLGSSIDGELVGVDPDTAHIVTRRTIRDVANYDSMAMAVRGELWATTSDGELLKIDVRDREVVERTRPFRDATDYVAVAAVGEHIYAVSGQVPRLVQIDPGNARVTAQHPITLTSANDYPQLVTQPDGTLWLVRGPTAVDLLDTETGQPVTSYSVPLTRGDRSDDYFFGGITSGFGSLWSGVWPDSFDAGALVRQPLTQP